VSCRAVWQERAAEGAKEAPVSREEKAKLPDSFTREGVPIKYPARRTNQEIQEGVIYAQNGKTKGPREMGVTVEKEIT